MWSKKQLDEIQTKLSKYQDAMNSRLLGLLRERVEKILKEQAHQTLVINEHTKQLVASALLDIHAASTRSLQEQTHILTNLATQKQTASVSSINTKDVVTADVLQWSYGMATTTEEAQVFSKIQHDEAQLHKEVAKRITDSLWYEKFDERYETANEAHEKTFEWILQPRQSGDETQWSDFVKWLREGDDLF
ncbi:hypothetical protein B0J14DRAFT_314680 [Halenospora varia]|nr:hypothetical protein B0J14DRAFT_314680 [Halenospora varia]